MIRLVIPMCFESVFFSFHLFECQLHCHAERMVDQISFPTFSSSSDHLIFGDLFSSPAFKFKGRVCNVLYGFFQLKFLFPKKKKGEEKEEQSHHSSAQKIKKRAH